MTENKYQNGKIYKITDIGYNKCYYGSTTETLSQRLARHRVKYRIYKEGKNKGLYSAHILFDEFGIDNCKIELVELFPCNDKEELCRQEGHYIKDNPCVNKYIAGRTDKEYYEANREDIMKKKKEYYEANREAIKNYKKEYIEANHEDLKKKAKAYREANQEDIKNKMNQYREANREDINNKANQCHVCPYCDRSFTLRNKARHEKSNKHQAALQTNL